jgi:6-phosphogluconolactonase
MRAGLSFTDRALCLCLFTVTLTACLTRCDAQRRDQASTTSEIDVWIGTGGGLSKGIYHCRLNTDSGKLTNPTLAAEAGGPGFLAMHPSQPVLYAVCRDMKEPVVAAYRVPVDRRQPQLEWINSLPIGDGGAAHVSVDPTGRMLLTAQYGGGSVAAFSINDDGSLKEQTVLIDHEGGSGVVPRRQESSHAHWTGFSPDHRFAFVPDLGLDKVVVYRCDVEQASLTPHGFMVVPPGSGPRHMKFHTNGRFIFVLNELSLTITTFRYDAATGTTELIETVPTVPAEQKAKEMYVSASEIRVHPSGRFVYAANRGHDTVTAFAFDESTGRLTLIEREHIRGATPRNFNLDPSGKWLLAAGQDSHTLASFAVNAATGELTYNRSIVHAPAAICVLFVHE